ncbi:MAG TPA: DUF4349 domain-containing protein [Vicinamibacterales bacterium]|nr:DUF4349 domain-containing protein [Vicinamibacterales bacterium]
MLALSGCARKQAPPPPASAPAEFASTSRIATVERPADSTLAYAHQVTAEVPADGLLRRLDAVRAACVSDRANACTVLDVARHDEGGVPSGRVVVRLAPAGVDPLVRLAGQGGRLLSVTTHADDLAEPVQDTERQVAQLNAYRAKLTDFLQRRDLGVDQLLTVSKELAGIQTQIDDVSTKRATLRRRIDTDLLTVSLQVPRFEAESQASRVGEALRGFFSTMTNSLADVIEFTAAFLPWLVIVVPGFLGIRWLWNRTSQWLRSRSRPPAGN